MAASSHLTSSSSSKLSTTTTPSSHHFRVCLCTAMGSVLKKLPLLSPEKKETLSNKLTQFQTQSTSIWELLLIVAFLAVVLKTATYSTGVRKCLCKTCIYTRVHRHAYTYSTRTSIWLIRKVSKLNLRLHHLIELKNSVIAVPNALSFMVLAAAALNLLIFLLAISIKCYHNMVCGRRIRDIHMVTTLFYSCVGIRFTYTDRSAVTSSYTLSVTTSQQFIKQMKLCVRPLVCRDNLKMVFLCCACFISVCVSFVMFETTLANIGDGLYNSVRKCCFGNENVKAVYKQMLLAMLL